MTIKCPATHKVALGRGTCCCKESIVIAKISDPSITTPCNECDDANDSTNEDTKDCLTEYGKEYCINHGKFKLALFFIFAFPNYIKQVSRYIFERYK